VTLDPEILPAGNYAFMITDRDGPNYSQLFPFQGQVVSLPSASPSPRPSPTSPSPDQTTATSENTNVTSQTPTASSVSTTSGSGSSGSGSAAGRGQLSTGAKAGIGAGAGVVGLVAFAVVTVLVYRRGKAAGYAVGQGQAVRPPGGDAAELGVEEKRVPQLGGQPIVEAMGDVKTHARELPVNGLVPGEVTTRYEMAT
jgi:hypothetical protein